MSNEDPPDAFKEALAGVVLNDTSAVLTLDSVNAELPQAPSGDPGPAFNAVETTQLGSVLQEDAASGKIDNVFDQALASIVSQDNSPAQPSPEHDPGKDI